MAAAGRQQAEASRRAALKRLTSASYFFFAGAFLAAAFLAGAFLAGAALAAAFFGAAFFVATTRPPLNKGPASSFSMASRLPRADESYSPTS